MGLERYFQKRDFSKTAEPRGKVHLDNHHLFIIQKHAASHLHYDFRIELEGVLKSWAVPKGPCFDPTVKRLAMHVEDHPIEYGSFEGIIPKGEYGGGTVLLWDKGTWEPLDKNPVEAYSKGHLRFELYAEKLHGRWDLLRFKSGDQENTWFLIKYKDEYARPLSQYDITLEEINSVKSGQTLEEIAENYKAVWTKHGLKKTSKKKSSDFHKINLDLPKSPFPGFLSPQLATLVSEAPTGNEWLHEIKFDGYRILALKKGKKVQLFSRSNKEWTQQFLSIVHALEKIPLQNVILDGELTFLDKENRSSFQLLQNSIDGNHQGPFTYYIFDLLYYGEWDIRSLPLIERKKLLEPLIANVSENLRYSDHVLGQGTEMYKRSCEFALEGIISKRTDSEYVGKRSKSWLKIKCTKRQEFVIAGYTPAQGSRSYFGSLYLGIYDENGAFRFCGNVGTGFTEKSLTDIYNQLKKLKTSQNPFSFNPPGIKTATWVKPELIAEIEFSEWTKDGRLRHPSFKGLRKDKKAKQVTIETPVEGEKNIPMVKITNPNKILYPEDNITKKDIFAYYTQIVPFILPFINKRPLTLVRCPRNFKTCFFQKHYNKSTAKTLNPIPITNKKDQSVENYIYVSDLQGLQGLVQMSVLEIHPWGSTIDHLEQPDILIFDLDPAPEISWKNIVEASLQIKNYLKELQLQSFVKTTGGKGLHVVLPILPEHDWEVIRNFSELFVQFIQQQHPDKYVVNMSKSKRSGKIFLDYLRNQRDATAISAYSTRARPHAPVAVPVAWEELTDNINDTFFTIRTLPKRLMSLKLDPWAGFWELKQSLKI